jgi:hypothetical protein
MHDQLYQILSEKRKRLYQYITLKINASNLRWHRHIPVLSILHCSLTKSFVKSLYISVYTFPSGHFTVIVWTQRFHFRIPVSIIHWLLLAHARSLQPHAAALSWALFCRFYVSDLYPVTLTQCMTFDIPLQFHPQLPGLIICFTGFHEIPFASQDIFNVLTTLPSLIALQVFVQNGGQYVKYLCLYSISFTFKAFTCHSTFTSLFFPLLIKIKWVDNRSSVASKWLYQHLFSVVDL